MLRRSVLGLLVLSGGILAAGLMVSSAFGGTCGNCNEDIRQCFPLAEYTPAVCCVSGSCHQCTREEYLCKGGPDTLGPPFNCHSPGGACN